MTSPAQFAANRLNAQKSTGPITPAGKARAARSSLWHGLTAASLVVLDEDEADFDNFHTWLVSDLRPVGELEYSLVERIAVLSWRLRRVAKAEAALINRSGRYKGGYPVPADQPEPADTDTDTAPITTGGHPLFQFFHLWIEWFHLLSPLFRWNLERIQQNGTA